jgi:hypothetical protein
MTRSSQNAPDKAEREDSPALQAKEEEISFLRGHVAQLTQSISH